ncbi:MAG TPA: hypothetical protein VNU68_07935 [Verrucomicrobiae bacterium]|nr:hypothetical protein [Verrucomicrobiae bacterium]
MNRSTNYVRISRIKLLASVVVLTAMVTGWWRLTSASPVTLVVVKMVPRDRETELVSEDDEWSSGFVEATLVLANTSDRPIFYQGVMDAANVEHVCLWQEGSGWRGGGESCGLSLSSYTLQPSQSVTFTALLLPESICKVAVDYEDGRAPGKMWNLLPDWFTSQLPWCQRRRRVTTQEFDASKPDQMRTAKWYQRAAALGNEPARDRMDQLSTPRR